MDGLLIIDKPSGMTSADVVRVVQKRLRCKTGHLGTLDPFASGVLPLCLGEGTKIAQFLNAADKEYAGIIRLGQQTDTGDLTGKVIAAAPLPSLSAAQLVATARRFQGDLRQLPPMYSAIKQQGTPLYKLARRGMVVERTERVIRVDAITLTCPQPGAIQFVVACSKGTYIRVLAEDIAASLGTVGHVEVLRRTRFGVYTLQDAIAIGALESGSPPLIGLRAALPGVPEIQLDAAGARAARAGYQPLLASISLGHEQTVAKLIDPAGTLVAVIVREPSGRWRFARVFAQVDVAASVPG